MAKWMKERHFDALEAELRRYAEEKGKLYVTPKELDVLDLHARQIGALLAVYADRRGGVEQWSSCQRPKWRIDG